MGPPISIRESGDEKDKNRLLVYGGGSLIAFMLDVEMRQATQHSASVDLLMATLFQEFGHHKKRFSIDDIIRVTNELTKKDFKPFFDQYVTGNSPLPIKDYLKKVGLQLDTFVEEIYISLDPMSTKEQLAFFKAMFTF